MADKKISKKALDEAKRILSKQNGIEGATNERALLDYVETPSFSSHMGNLPEQDLFWYGTPLVQTYAFITNKKEFMVLHWECTGCSTKKFTLKKPTACCHEKDIEGKQGNEKPHKLVNPFEEKYNVRTTLDIGFIAPRMARDTIKKYLDNTEKQKLAETYLGVRTKILHYMDFGEQECIADVLTCWILATYIYEVFDWFPHILFNAPSQSGKTKAAIAVLQLAYRGYDLGASAGVTPAQIFRTMEGNKGTILFDEFEQTDPKDEGIRLVNQLLNSSASRDAYIIRLEQIGRKWVPTKFPIFCPKIACNISGINPTSLSRYIAFSWLKTANAEKSKRKPHRQQDKLTFAPIVESCHLFALEHWKEVLDEYQKGDFAELKNREFDNWAPILAVARVIDTCKVTWVGLGVCGGSTTSRVKTYLDTYKELDIETGDTTKEFFISLSNCLKQEAKEYSCKEIAGFELIANLLSNLKSPPHWIGRKLKAYKFPNRILNGNRVYTLSKDTVDKLCNLYFNTEVSPPKSPNPPNPLNPLNPPNPPTLPPYSISRSQFEQVGFQDGGTIHQHCKVCNIATSKYLFQGEPYCVACAESKVLEVRPI